MTRGRWPTTREPDVEVDVFCLVDGPGATLPTELLGEAAALPAELVLDVYPPETDAEGKSTVVTFMIGAGDVVPATEPPGADVAEQLATLAGDPRLAADGRWEVAYASGSGQGSIEIGPAWLARLAAVGAPLTVRLAP